MTTIDEHKEAFVVLLRNLVYSDSQDCSCDSKFDDKVSCATDSVPVVVGVFTSMALANQCVMQNSVEDNQVIEIVRALVNQPKGVFSSTLKSHRKRRATDLCGSKSTSESDEDDCDNKNISSSDESEQVSSTKVKETKRVKKIEQ
jgi:hypothetical protein